MKQLNQKMTCEIVRDLLPLYVDGACTESSRVLVQEHIQECERCSNMLEAMRAPLYMKAEVRQTAEQKIEPVKKAVHRLKRRSLIAGVLAILVLFPMLFLGVNQYRGEGISFSGIRHIAKTEQIMKTWKESGLAGVSEKLSSPQTEYEIVTTPHVFYQDIEEQYVEYTAGGETYLIQKESINLSSDGDMQPSFDLNKKRSEVEMWHELLRQSNGGKMIPEWVYQQLNADYGEEYCAELMHHPIRIETKYGVFYSTEATTAHFERANISEDMQRVVQDFVQPDQAFQIGSYTTVMSKTIYDAYVKQCRQIDQWYQEYADYYKKLGFDGFLQLWRERAAQMVEDVNLRDCHPTEYEYQAVHRDASSLNENGEWTVEWQVTLANGAKGQMWLTESVNGGYRISAVFGDGTDLKEKLNNSYQLMSAQHYAESTWWLYD